MNEAALCLIVFLSALGGGAIGFIYGYFYGGLHAHRENRSALQRQNIGYHRGAAGGGEMLGGWESCSVLPLEAQGKLASDQYPRKD